jgi:hypothetical protein
LTDLTFSLNGAGSFVIIFLFVNGDMFVVCSGRGTDVTDSSTNAASHYSRQSVMNCASTSPAVKFYLSVPNVILDCLLTNTCPTLTFYVSTDGTDFPFCGDSTSPCASLVCRPDSFYSFYLCILLFFCVRNLVSSHHRIMEP